MGFSDSVLAEAAGGEWDGIDIGMSRQYDTLQFWLAARYTMCRRFTGLGKWAQERQVRWGSTARGNIQVRTSCSC
jgi:hypothetical protein